jgi:AraC-like DNA-binding protein
VKKVLESLKQLSLVIIHAGIVQGFFVAFLLNRRNGKRSRANVFLSILLVSLSFSIAHILFTGHVLHHFAINVYSIGDPTFLLISPLLWFYTSELIGQKVGLSRTMFIHFIPFLIVVIFSLTVTSIRSDEVIHFLQHSHRMLRHFFWIGVVIQFSCYLFFIHKRWNAYQHLLQQETSNTDNVSISWVRFFMAVFLAMNVFFLFTLFASIHFGNHEWSWTAIAMVFSLSVFALGYKGMLQKEIFYPGIQDDKPADPGMQRKEPNQRVLEKPDQELINKVLHYMEEKKPFLDPELTLSSLAKALELNRTQLSQLINEGMGDNFYDFVNKYRVEEVKKLMADPKTDKLNLLGIALEAGFKSKSTFNLIFKRFTGLTPTDYKKTSVNKDVQ